MFNCPLNPNKTLINHSTKDFPVSRRQASSKNNNFEFSLRFAHLVCYSEVLVRKMVPCHPPLSFVVVSNNDKHLTGWYVFMKKITWWKFNVLRLRFLPQLLHEVNILSSVFTVPFRERFNSITFLLIPLFV